MLQGLIIPEPRMLACEGSVRDGTYSGRHTELGHAFKENQSLELAGKPVLNSVVIMREVLTTRMLIHGMTRLHLRVAYSHEELATITTFQNWAPGAS